MWGGARVSGWTNGRLVGDREEHMTTLHGARVSGWTIGGWVGGFAGLALAGCAGSTTALRAPPLRESVVRATAGDMRGNAIVSGREAQPLVAGPMKLLHVNTEGRKEPRFSRVWRRGGVIDCHNATPLAWDGESTVEIAKDELVCVSADEPARLFWHGRSVAPERLSAPRQASLLP